MSEILNYNDYWVSKNAKINEEIQKTPNKFREGLLNTDTSQLNYKDLARYLILLTQEINTSKKENTEQLALLWKKIPGLQERLKAISENWKISEKTKWLIFQMDLLLEDLRKSLEENLPIEYSKLQSELTESQIDDATNKMNSILWDDASVINIWVGKYVQAWLENLRGTIPDVDAVNDKLKSYNSPRQLSFIDESATKEAILSAIRNSPPDKWLFLYFSGHWVDGHMIPYSADPLVTNDELNFDLLISPKELFAAIGNRKTMVIVDKCQGWDLTLWVPPNITVVSSTDSVNSAIEKNIEWSDASRNASMLKSVRDEVKTTSWVRWIATYGMTNSTQKWLDLRWFTNSASKQQPTIAT